MLDNASEDGSAEAVAELFPWARVIAQPFRAGFGANHNAVIRSTTGALRLRPERGRDRRAGLVRAARRLPGCHPEGRGRSPRIRYPDGREQASAWRFPTPGAAALGAVTLARAGIVQSHGDETKRVDWAMACALLLRRSALDEAGVFDEGFFIYSEETDLAKRFEAAGYETHYLPSVTAFHHVSQFSARIPERRIAEEWRSRRRYWQQAPFAPRRPDRRGSDRLAVRARALVAGAVLSPPGACSRRPRPHRAGPVSAARAERLARPAGARPARAGGRLEPRARRLPARVALGGRAESTPGEARKGSTMSATVAVGRFDARASTYDGSRVLEALLFVTAFCITFSKIRIKVAGDLNFFLSDLTALALRRGVPRDTGSRGATGSSRAPSRSPPHSSSPS